jgi:hypothetical protein
LAAAVKALQAAYSDAAVELWTTDEHRIGLKPIPRLRQRLLRLTAPATAATLATAGEGSRP